LASTTSPEASEIRRRGRRRLIGAIALVMLLVVFVPMVLDPEPGPARGGPTLAIPPKEGAEPLPPPKAAPPVAPPTAAPAPGAKPAEVKALESKPAPEAKPAAEPKAEAKAEAAPKLEGFAVQVGAFRDEAKLAQARDKLAAAGVVHYTERLDSKGGALTRLRAGPFPTREAAEAALAKLKRSALDGKVVPLAAEQERKR
jgi:DedD protein